MSQDILSGLKTRQTLSAIDVNGIQSSTTSHIPQLTSSVVKKNSVNQFQHPQSAYVNRVMNTAQIQPPPRISLAPGRSSSFRGSSMNVGNHRESILRSDGKNSTRHSIAPSSMRRSSVMSSAMGSRLSTIGSFASNHTNIKDPRNHRDRNIQARYISTIMTVLQESGYPHPLTQKTLQTPTAKDFTQIFKFLYNLLDPEYQFVKKIEDEVISCLKEIRYPFVDGLSKSQLMAVGSMHSWPGILAMLFWLAELSAFAMDDGESAVNDLDDSVQLERLFFPYLCKTYGLFLQGEDDFTEHDEALEEDFNERGLGMQAMIEKLTKENNTLKEDIRKINQSAPPLDTMEEELKVLQSDLEKFNEYLKHLDQKKVRMQESITVLKNERLSQDNEAKTLQEEFDKCRKEVDASGISLVDVDRMIGERDSLVKGLESLSISVEGAGKTSFEKETIAQKKISSLEKLVAQYNALGYKIGLLPETAPRAKGKNYFLEFYGSDNSNMGHKGEKLTNIDLRYDFRPIIQKARQEVTDEMHDLQDAYIQKQEALDKIGESIMDRLDEIESAKAKVAQLLGRYSEVMDNTSEHLSSVSAEHEKVERDTHQGKLNMQNGLTQLDSRLQSVSREFELLKEYENQFMSDMQDQVVRAIDDVVKFKVHISDGLEQMELVVMEETALMQQMNQE